MYEMARRLDPESIYAIARLAYAELAMAGVTAIGEFHYVHHQQGGQPYEERTALADAVIEAALSVGIRISLLRVLYQRGGAGLEPEPDQLRFCDPSLELALSDVDALRSRHADNDRVRVGVAIHSVRAVSKEWMLGAAAYARQHDLPLHMHLSEQRRELEECVAEHGTTPVRLVSDLGILGPRFVAVHATHLEEGEAQLLGQAGAFACICRTTERDLGDGHCDAVGLVEAGVRLCTGVDSHAIADPFEEMRAIELDERSHREARTVAADASALLAAGSVEGYSSIGFDEDCLLDRVSLDARDPALLGFHPELLDDAVVYAAGPRSVQRVEVAGRQIVNEGRHVDEEAIRAGFLATLRDLRE